jgi:hypothetical protein
VKTRIAAIALFSALALLSVVAHGQQKPLLTPPRPGFSFPQKQTLTYAVDWRVFPAGTAVLHFEAVGDRERINANADTSGAINLLFHVSDRFQSSFRPDQGLHRRLQQADHRGPPPGQLDAPSGLQPEPLHSE